MKRMLTVLFTVFTVSLLFADISVLHIGVIEPKEPALTIKKHSVINNYLVEKLKGTGVTSCEIVAAPNSDKMVKLIKEKKVDLVIETVFAILFMKDKAPVDIILRRWKKGIGEYETYFIVKKDSSISSLKGLSGKIIGFEDPDSSSARWMPQVMLNKEGYVLKEVKGDSNINLAKNEIGYVFTGDSENTPIWIMKNKIDIGAISTNDFNDTSEQIRNELKVITKSAPIPRQLIAIRSDYDKKIRDKIISVFVDMSENNEGKDILKQWEKTSKLDRITKDVQKTIDNIRGLIRYLKK